MSHGGSRPCGILLAAGAGRRFGADKRCWPLADGTAMAVAAARNLAHALGEAWAVVRPNDRALMEMLTTEGLRIAVCENAAEGMAASLVRGVTAAAAAPAWVIALADMPFIQPQTIAGVARLLEAGAVLAAPDYRGRRGHPVGFGAVFREQLLGLRGDQGARGVVERHKARLRTLAVQDPGAIIDIDVPADIAAAQIQLRQGRAGAL